MLEKVEMTLQSVIKLIVGVLNLPDYGAYWTTHQYSNARAGDPRPCSEYEIVQFVKELADGAEQASLVIGDVDWEESGGCVGDALYPSQISAVRLPDGRYFIELDLYEETEGKLGRVKVREEYIFSF